MLCLTAPASRFLCPVPTIVEFLAFRLFICLVCFAVNVGTGVGASKLPDDASGSGSLGASELPGDAFGSDSLSCLFFVFWNLRHISSVLNTEP